MFKKESCPRCGEWFYKEDLKEHLKTCKAKTKERRRGLFKGIFGE
jgi:acetyl-CoA carboxylase beta subunit